VELSKLKRIASHAREQKQTDNLKIDINALGKRKQASPPAYGTFFSVCSLVVYTNFSEAKSFVLQRKSTPRLTGKH
jgi:hypothetical protein